MHFILCFRGFVKMLSLKYHSISKGITKLLANVSDFFPHCDFKSRFLRNKVFTYTLKSYYNISSLNFKSHSSIIEVELDWGHYVIQIS